VALLSQLTGKELGDFVCFCGGCAGRVGRMVDGFGRFEDFDLG